MVAMDIKDVVSKDEVEALLDDSSDRITTGNSDSQSHDVYDFTHHGQKNMNDLSKVEMINDVFMSEIRAKISHFLSRNAYVLAEPAKVMTYDDFLKTIEKPACIYFASMRPLMGVTVFAASGNLVSRLIEMLFGGDIKTEPDLTREFGKAELQITQLLLNLINQTLSKAWESVKPVYFETIQATTKFSLLKKSDQREQTLVTQYTLCIEKQELTFSHCIPIATLEPIMHLLEGDEEANVTSVEHTAWSQAFTQNVYNIRVPVTAVVASASIKLLELQELREGDILAIDNPSTAEIYAGDVHIFRAKCGVNNGNRAVKVINLVND
jgi:flagellar motor switch protein FliM